MFDTLLFVFLVYVGSWILCGGSCVDVDIGLMWILCGGCCVDVDIMSGCGGCCVDVDILLILC